MVELLTDSISPATKMVCRVTHRGEHNHEIVPQRNAVTEAEKNLLVQLPGHSGTRISKSVKVMKGVELVSMQPDRQTAYNIKRKADGRQVGEDGDLERVKEMLGKMKDEIPGFYFRVNADADPSRWRIVIQTRKCQLS